MAYATGSATNLNGLLDAIRLFAIAQGWAVGKWTSASNLLFLSKGQCFVTMQGGSQLVAGFPDIFSDILLNMSIGTALNNTLDTYNGHPGSLVTDPNDGDRIAVNDMAGPFGVYHLFSGDEANGDPAYIHVVVRTGSNRWQHFSFGNLDKRGLSHSGVGYLVGANRFWYRHSAAALNFQNFNSPAFHACPFTQHEGLRNFTASTSMVHVPDALPSVWAAPLVTTNMSSGLTLLRTLIPVERPTNYGDNSTIPTLNGNVVVAPVLAPSGILPLWSLPCILSNNVNLCYVGDYPNVRLCNLEGLTAEQRISFGSDDWIVFPVMALQPWGNDRTGSFDGPSSGQYGVAYRKIV